MQEQTQIRMDKALKDRIRKYKAKLEKQLHVEVTFSQATRALIEQGLEKVGI